MNPGVLIGVAVLGLAACFGAGLWSIDGSGGYAGLSPRFLPLLVTFGLGTCGLLIITSSLAGRFVAADESELPGSREPRARPLRHLGWLLAGLLMHLLLIGQIGFIAASVLLMVCVARGYGSQRPGRDALVSIAITVPIWALFSVVLGIGLPVCPLLGR